MNTPIPAARTEAADLWDQLKDIGRDDGAELDRIIWRLLLLAKKQSSDFVARLACGRALLMRGRREEALPHVDAAYGLRYSQGAIGIYNLAGVLLDCGRLQDVRMLLTQLLDSPEAKADKSLYAAALGYALRSGELEFLKRALNRTAIGHQEAMDFIAMLERDNLSDVFRRHQSAVETLLGPYTCTFYASVEHDGEGGLGATLEYFTALTGRRRLELYRPLTASTMEPPLLSVADHVAIGIWGPEVQVMEAAE